MICDCCLQPYDRLWVYRHRAVCFVRHDPPRNEVEVRAGWWAFCVYCHELFVAGEIRFLVARVETLAPHIDVFDITLLYNLLPDLIYGDHVLWTPGSAYHFEIPEVLS